MTISLIIAICDALASIPAIAGLFSQFCQVIIGWYVSKQQGDTLSAIADAAAFGARATDKDRYEAAQKWRDALSRARLSP